MKTCLLLETESVEPQSGRRVAQRPEMGHGRNRVAVGDHLRIVTQGSSVGDGEPRNPGLGGGIPLGFGKGAESQTYLSSHSIAC